MIQGSYDIISKIVKEIRGFTLADNPSNFQEIMLAYDNMQQLKAGGLKVVLQLLKDTQLWIGILRNHSGIDSPKYIVASNKIACTCIELVQDMVGSTCFNVTESDLEPHLRHDLSSRVNELLNVLSQIEKLCVVPETHKVYKDMVKKLLIAQEQLMAFEISV